MKQREEVKGEVEEGEEGEGEGEGEAMVWVETHLRFS